MVSFSMATMMYAVFQGSDGPYLLSLPSELHMDKKMGSRPGDDCTLQALLEEHAGWKVGRKDWVMKGKERKMTVLLELAWKLHASLLGKTGAAKPGPSRMSLNSDEEGLNSHAISLSSQSSLQSFSPCHYQCISTLRGHSSYVSGLAVDGNSLYAASSDGHIRLWSLDHMQQEEQCGSVVAVTDSAIKCLMATSDGLVSSHQDGKIRAWHAGRRNGGHLALQSVLPTTADCLRTFLFPKNYVEVRRHRSCTWVHHVDAVTALAVSPDGAHMYSASWDRSLKVWRLPSLRCVESVAPAHGDAINAVAVASDGRVYTGSADRTIRAWRRHPGQKKLALVGTMERHASAVNALAVGVGGLVLYSGSCDRSVVVWEGGDDAGGMAAACTLRGHTGAVLCLAAAGDVVCSGSADRTVRVWRRGAEGGYSCLAVLDGHGAAVKSLALVLTGGDHGEEDSSRCAGCSALVCSGSLDCDVKIWRVT